MITVSDLVEAGDPQGKIIAVPSYQMMSNLVMTGLVVEVRDNGSIRVQLQNNSYIELPPEESIAFPDINALTFGGEAVTNFKQIAANWKVLKEIKLNSPSS